MGTRISACLAVLALLLGSIVDSPVSCQDGACMASGSDMPGDGLPTTQDTCAGTPCSTVVDLRGPSSISRAVTYEVMTVLACAVPATVDDAAPPTPPPNEAT